MLIDKDKIILTRPEKGINLRKIASLVNILFFWAMTLYLMRSLLIIFGWLFVYVSFRDAFVPTVIEGATITNIKIYLPMIALAAASLWGWATYNRLRYGGVHDKRHIQPPPLALEDVSAYTRLSVDKIAEMRNTKTLVCHFDECCEVNRVDCISNISLKAG